MGHNWSLGIGYGHQLVAQLHRPSLGGAQRPLVISTFVVFRASIHVFLAIPQHGVDDLASLWAVAVRALGAPRWAFFRRRKAPRALSERCSALAARRKAAAARLALGLVFELLTLPPVIRLSGLSPSHDAKCLVLGHLVMSVPISLITFRAVYASTPSIRVRSTPVI